MISVVIGGEDGEEIFETLYLELNSPYVLRAGKEGAFQDFCRRAVASTEIIRIKTNGELVDTVANDDMLILLSTSYLQGAKTPVLYKLATAIETSIDLGLDIQVFSLVNERMWNAQNWQWPDHWPDISVIIK